MGQKQMYINLENEIDAELSISDSLRTAFEGRRGRSHAAELAAQNAEIITMRRQRGNHAAESSLQAQEEAAELFRSEHLVALASSNSKAEALEVELSELHKRLERAQANVGPSSASSSASEQPLEAARAELLQALRGHASEESEEQAWAREVAELEAVREQAEEELVSRERVLRSASSGMLPQERWCHQEQSLDDSGCSSFTFNRADEWRRTSMSKSNDCGIDP